MGTKWSSPRSETPPPPTPFSTIPTLLVSSPRMIGRLEAPGAKLDPVIPGFENSRSPNVLLTLRRSSSLGTTVTVANWSVTIGSVPGKAASAAGDAAGVGTGAAGALAAGEGRTIGLGAVTTISGSA